MAQVTESLIAEYERAHAEGKHAPMTIGEEQQLIHAWKQQHQSQQSPATTPELIRYGKGHPASCICSLCKQSPARVEGELTFEAWWGQATGYSQMTKMELAEFAWKACASMRQPPAHADLLSVLQEAIDGMGGSYGVWAPKAKAVVAKYAGCALNQRLAVKEGEAKHIGTVFFPTNRKAPDVHWESNTPITDGAKLYTHPVSDDQQAKDAALENFDATPAFYIDEMTANTIKHTALINGKVRFSNKPTAECTVPVHWQVTLSTTKQEEV